MLRHLSVLLALACAATDCSAQAGISTLLDTGIRASGMGRSGTALFWGDNPDVWANPALLGFQQGIRYVHGKTQLIPDLASNVFLKSDGVAVGDYGLGFYTSGKPIDGFGRVRLDYGTSEARGPGGEDFGTFQSWEEVHSWSVGANILQLTDNILHVITDKSPDLSRWGDVSLGMAKKHVEVFLAPDLPFLPPGAGQGQFDAQDKGILVRATPYDGLDHRGYWSSVEKKVRARLDVAYGGSSINEDDPVIVFGPLEPQPVGTDSRRAVALHLVLHPTEEKEARMAQGSWNWLTHFWRPALSLAYTWDQSEFPGTFRDTSGAVIETTFKEHRYGFEAVFLNMLGFRVGHVNDPSGSIVGTTWGFDVGANYEHLAGARYEWASVPQASDPALGIHLQDVHRQGVMVFLEPIRLWERLR